MEDQAGKPEISRHVRQLLKLVLMVLELQTGKGRSSSLEEMTSMISQMLIQPLWMS